MAQAEERREHPLFSAIRQGDLDYADAITKMNMQLVGLQAAQMSYSKISNLSLFNYLR